MNQVQVQVAGKRRYEQAVYRMSDIGAMLGCTTQNVARLIKLGRIPSFKVGGSVYIPKAEFDAWLLGETIGEEKK